MSWVLHEVQLRCRPSGAVTLSFLLLSLAAAGTLSADPTPADCEPRDCGDGLEISYPFWISGVHNSYCGYPGYNVSCNDVVEGAAHIDDGVETYVVRKIFYDNMSLIVAYDQSTAAARSPAPCPLQHPPRHNLSFSPALYNVSSVNRELLFYHNCTETAPGLSTVEECADNGRGTKVSLFAVRQSPAAAGNVSPPPCESVVVSPFLQGDGDRSYGSLLSHGFLLEWRAPNCNRCRSSGGRCGYSETDQYYFMCICSDSVHRVSCDGPTTATTTARSGISKAKKIAIGVGAGVGGFLLACVLCFLVYRRKRMRARTGSSTLLFRTASSEPPSQKDPETGSTHYYPTHVFKYEELSEATDRFSEANELGDGGFGTVYKGKLRDGRIVAVKRLYESNYKRVEQFMNEVAILHRLQHPNLVTLYGCTSRHSRELLLVYEYVPNGTVADHLHGEDRAAVELGSPSRPRPPLGWPVRLGIAVETATALAYLHKVEPPIIHRDVKTNNILLDDNFHVKVADFGLSRLFPADVTHVSTAPQGTPGYVDPEYHQCYQLTDKSDVYSFGVVLAELISSKPAVDITRHRHEINLATMAINKIQTGALGELVDPALNFDTDWETRRMVRLVAELAFRCLQAEKEMRPTMEDVAEVLRGIRDCREDDDAAAAAAAAGDTAVRDDASLLKNKNVPFSPDSVMDKWTSRTTTPNTSA